MSRDRRTDDRRSDRVRTGDAYENDDERGGFLAPVGWPSWPGTGAAEETPNETYDERRAASEDRRDERSDGGSTGKWVSLLLVGGLALFFFPEPVTSMAGVLLMGLGVVLWAVGRFR